MRNPTWISRMRTPETPDRRFENSIWCPSPGTACPTRRGELGSGSRGLGLSLRLGWKMPWEAVRGTVNLIPIVRRGRRRKEDRNSRRTGRKLGGVLLEFFSVFASPIQGHTLPFIPHTPYTHSGPWTRVLARRWRRGRVGRWASSCAG
jgi:hypothetical protein